MRARPRSLAAVLVIVSALGLSALAIAQPRNIFYVYDDLSRLVAVVDQQGNAATYTYDAVGNILEIQRFDAAGIPGVVGITLLSPGRGKVGTPVQIFGKGFGAVAAQHAVSFAGTPATVTGAAPNRLVTSVPISATSGPVTVTTPLGSATSAAPFIVLGAITVHPTSAIVVLNGSFQFGAREAGTPTTRVHWAVEGLPGGDTSVGTISTTGLYRAPATIPSPATVTVTATHKDDRELAGSATVTVIPPQPIFLAARTVSVQVAAPGRASATPVSVALEPLITAVSPASTGPGTPLTVTLTGSGFGGATGVSFLLNGANDPTITAANLAVSPEGTRATVDISVAGGAPSGARVVRITTPTRASTALGTTGNRFTVQ